MNTKRLIRNSYMKIIILLSILCMIGLFVFFSLFMEKTEASEGEAFIKECDEFFPFIQDFAMSYSDETLARIIENNRNLNLGFCIRTNDGSPVWLSGETLMFESDSDPQVKGYIFPDAGFTAEDYYRIMQFAAWRLEIEGKTYQYEMTGKKVYKSDGFFFVPEEIGVVSYIVEDPLKIKSNLTRVPGEEIIRIQDKEKRKIESDFSEVNCYSGTITQIDLFPLNDSIGFADDINRFNLNIENYDSDSERINWIGEDAGIFKKVFTCVCPVKTVYGGKVVDAYIVFAKYVNFGEKYLNSILMLLFLVIAVFLITGIILCINTKKTITAMYSVEQNRRIMVNSIAHDLKTPATAISAYAELIKDKEFEENRDLFAEKIIKNSEVLENQLKSIVMFSRIDNPGFKLKRESVELKVLTENALTGFDHDVGFSAISIVGEKIFISADRKLMQMAIENFVSNALKNLSGENREIIIDINKRSWSIFNTGNHIAAENLTKIWEPWFVEDSSGRNSGSGLGLYIAKTILDAHNMTYTAENTEKGVRFAFYYDHLAPSEITYYSELNGDMKW